MCRLSQQRQAPNRNTSTPSGIKTQPSRTNGRESKNWIKEAPATRNVSAVRIYARNVRSLASCVRTISSYKRRGLPQAEGFLGQFLSMMAKRINANARNRIR